MAACPTCQKPVEIRSYWDTRGAYSSCDKCIKAWDGLPQDGEPLVIAIFCQDCQNCNASRKSALRVLPFFKDRG